MSLPRKILVASGNAGKLREIARLLGHLDIEFVPQSELGIPEADENGATFEDNALIKARHGVELTGLAAIADDSGLAVDALGGRPGVHSARYAGPGASDDDNVDKLLAELDNVDDRAAQFHCVACFIDPGHPEPLIARGAWHGEILRERRGDGGFGYDPVFLDPASGRASAELTPAQKNERSHRGLAFRALARKMSERSR